MYSFWFLFSEKYPLVSGWSADPQAVQWFIYEIGMRLDQFQTKKRHGTIYEDISNSLKKWNYQFSAHELVVKRGGMEATWCRYKGKLGTITWLPAYNEIKQGRCPPEPEAPAPVVHSPTTCARPGSSAQASTCARPGSSAQASTCARPVSSAQASTCARPDSACPVLSVRPSKSATPSTAACHETSVGEIFSQDEEGSGQHDVPYRLRGEGMSWTCTECKMK